MTQIGSAVCARVCALALPKRLWHLSTAAHLHSRSSSRESEDCQQLKEAEKRDKEVRLKPISGGGKSSRTPEKLERQGLKEAEKRDMKVRWASLKGSKQIRGSLQAWQCHSWL